LEVLLALLVILICISAFFSGSETGMMAINRYRLKNLERENNKAAKRVAKMLERPDRLCGHGQ
jgi:Mg2+/Co2+ transporter CorB